MNYLLRILVLSLGLPPALGAIRRDLNSKNVQVAEIDKHARINEEKQEILFENRDSDFVDSMWCSKRSGKRLTFSADRVFVACCAPGQKLLGTLLTAFDCCDEGHDLVGSDKTGYRCSPVCSNGKTMMLGRCVCPPGMTETADGGCKWPSVDCDSGITTGKCYIIKMENGQTFGYDSESLWYSADDNSYHHRLGKFQFCKDERCATDLSVNPSDAIRIKDIQGTSARTSELQGNQWLNTASSGKHIGRTQRYQDAGSFAITKWSCGKYCLGGLQDGVSLARTNNVPSITFTDDEQTCTPVEIIHVPCDVRAVENNCFWEKLPGTCGPGNSNSCHCPKA
ncbi:hypothetical protein GGR54DRAFT_629423 [Hypoxylon sp. NC1633]|nr:hypothetical protein GGR54DRAFT_629423 [Hypoxylon sp. NC1633]